MANQSIKTLGIFKKFSRIEKGIGVQLPEAYKKFYKEWALTEPAPVHYIEEGGKWDRNPLTGEVKPIQNNPIPLRFPPEQDKQLWGGEGVVQGFQKRVKWRRRVPHFWIPLLHRSVVHSEVLNKYMSVVVTKRAVELVHENYGFDHYLLKTLACDLRSLLAVGLKRKILQDLQNGCPAYEDPVKRQEVYDRYKSYLSSYTPDEIEWYGYSFEEAVKKFEALEASKRKIVPLKEIYRANLIQKLRELKANPELESVPESTWLSKINPFGKKSEVP